MPPKMVVSSLLMKWSTAHCTLHYTPRLGCSALYEVHRLDSTTTGVLLYVKTAARREVIKKLFAQRKIEKTYLAITNGVPK